MARPNTGLSTKVTVPMTPQLLEAVDDYRFEERIGNRSEALRKLLYLGLAAMGRTVDDDAGAPETDHKDSKAATGE